MWKLHAPTRSHRAAFSVRYTACAAIVLACLLALAACTIQIGGPPQGTSSPTSVPVKIVQGSDGATLILAPVKINNSGPYTFALDTGASVSAIDSSIARKLKLPVTGGPQQIAGVGGQQQEIPVRVKTWSAGSIHLPAATIGSLDLFGSSRSANGVQGLLGSDVLSQFGQITINYSAGELTVAHQITSTPHTPLAAADIRNSAFRAVPALD